MTELKTKIEYHDNGEKYQEYTVNSEGKTHGLYQKWYSNGQLREEIKYVNGKIHGLHQSWFENGQLEEEINYVNGKKQGLYQLFLKAYPLKMPKE